MKQIDVNSDLGEGFGPYKAADDEALLDLVSSANIACGFHAGDPVVMDRTVRLALARGVEIGAHVGYADRQGFGRRHIAVDHRELELMTLYQLGALQAIADAAGQRLTHANFHGALGNLSFVDADVADALLRAVRTFDRDLIFLALPNTEAERAAERHGLRVIRSFLADRAYDSRGLLVPRAVPGAVVRDPDRIAARITRLLQDGTVETIDGGTIRLDASSILVHSDTPGAVTLARIVVQAIREAGAEIVPLSQAA
ncbi:LamB/YcsF family protein [Methylobacterium nodulans]|uniref:5-oxoprolinase subunit A n=1 Tax=Methylobacterium nodulans (strain LMG 21967 / CNCM I-2342 / ORS 2060) TaxID=460265 RepID=B8IGM4_METNO|nr:5-oxoprolinase subunit PxpA [Methylobacterium nodulans]ACL55924.1 LamB/YcsF family protein [Methylobacterium nodulans ORS 2060]